MSEESKTLDIELLESSFCKGESDSSILLFVIDSFCMLDSRGLDTSRYHAQYDENFNLMSF